MSEFDETRPAALIDAFLDYLKAEGVEVVFGIPGGLLHSFFEAVEHDGDMDLVVAKHEEGSAFMADGYARCSGRLGVCAGTSGPGSTNLLTGVACAYADAVPLLVLTGQADSRHLGKGAAQETAQGDMDIVSMFEPITKYSARIEAPNRMLHHLRRALRRAMTGRPGPVHLNVPVNFWQQAVEYEEFNPAKYRPNTTVFDREAVKAAADILTSSERPVILAGSGVRIARAEDELLRFAEQIRARVATTPRGKGVFPEDHPMSMGVFGFAGHQLAMKTILGDDVDTLMSVGTALGETATFNWEPALMPSENFIQLDIDVDRLGRNYPVDVPLVGDAKTTLTELFFHTKRRLAERPLRSKWEEVDREAAESTRYRNPEMRSSERMPVAPQRWRADIGDLMPEDAIVFSDIGGHMLFNIHNLEISRDQDFIINLGFGSMGHGTAAPLGAALSCPDRPVVAIVGDACFTMNGMELLTAVEYELPIIWIIENNQMHGITWHASKLLSEKDLPIGSIRYRRQLNIAEMARTMGLVSFRVERPGQIRGAFQEALQSNGPCVIEVLVDPTIEPPLRDRVDTIQGFKR